MGAAETIGIGVIGAGAMARAYCECLRYHVRDVQLVAIAGGRRANVLASDYGAIAAPTIAALLARPDLRAVIIASPEMAHGEQAALAAAAGKHVLVEKPMAPTPEACASMIDACASAAVVLVVVKHWRFRGVHTRALGVLRGGTLGKVRRIENRTRVPLSSSLATVTQKPFYLDPAGGGLLMGWAVHNLDWVRLLAGDEPRTVVVRLFRRATGLGASALDAKFDFANGVVARVLVEIDLPAPPGPGETFRTDIELERGRLDLDGYGALRVQREGGEWETLWTQPAFDPRNATDPLRLEAYAAMLQAFIDSVRNGAAPPISGHDGRTAVSMFCAALAAAATGRPAFVSA